MARVALLFVNDSIVAPHLQLLRITCEPESTSRPHVTVRHFVSLEVPPEYRELRVSEIDLIEPGIFLPKPNQKDRQLTVFIKCRSNDLALTRLEHKPDFPNSAFHITIYQGGSWSFARKLLTELRRCKWTFRVPLAPQTALKIKELSGRRKKAKAPVDYPDHLKSLFRIISGRTLEREWLINLTEAGRLRVVRQILRHLAKVTTGFEHVNHITHGRVVSLKRASARQSPKALSEVHLTPPELAAQIASYAVTQLESKTDPIHFGDPAVGTGAFFAALLSVFPQANLASAIGIDINTEQVAASKWRWAEKGMEVRLGDYLHMDELPRRSLILANPPYLRHQAIPPKYKAKLRERAAIRTDINVSAQSGLFVYFLLLSHDWMQDGAIAAWLIPREFMRSGYGEAVRKYLSERVEIIRIHEFGPNTSYFERVKVAPAVVVFRKRTADPNHQVLLTAGGELDNPEQTDFVRQDALRQHATWSIPLVREPLDSPWVRIGDLFDIRRGIATGANDFFVMPREKAHALGIPRTATKPLIPRVKLLTADVIEADPDGFPKDLPQICVIDCAMPEEVVRRRFPRFAAYLDSADRKIRNRHLLKDRNPWYKQELRLPSPFLCTYMGRSVNGGPPIRFLWNKSNAIATNSYLMLYPKTEAVRRLLSDEDSARSFFAVLRAAAAKTMQHSSRIHAGGLHKIEPRDLANVRLQGLLGTPNEFQQFLPLLA